LLNDPYVLLEIVFEEMYKILDWTAWAIADTFGPLETQISGIASKPGKAAEELPKHFFTELHTLTKHTLYLRENCEAALATLNDLYSHHKVATGESPEMPQRHTRQALKYRKTLFESTQRRLASLNARLSNIIEMSFNIVTQGDSKLMQSENQSMKTIAVMTLVFMPLGTVASIFGSQFMKLQDERPYRLTVSRDFWLMWVIAIPLTAVVLTIWWVWYTEAKARLVDGVEKGGHGYMGWKTLLRRVKAKKGMLDA
jgi:Mg2+ and Co2+ transporter CorA